MSNIYLISAAMPKQFSQAMIEKYIEKERSKGLAGRLIRLKKMKRRTGKAFAKRRPETVLRLEEVKKTLLRKQFRLQKKIYVKK